MKYKTLFRVLLKFMAVWVFIEGLGTFTYAVINTIQYLYAGDAAFYFFHLDGLTWGMAQILIALYFFFGGKWVIDMAIPGNRPYCHECGYDLSHSPGTDCPECGTAFRQA